jgi:hypothetical protein
MRWSPRRQSLCSAGPGFWHRGHNPGYKCFALAVRDSRAGVVVMTNADAGRQVRDWIGRRTPHSARMAVGGGAAGVGVT